MKKNKRVLVTASFILLMLSSIFFLDSNYKNKTFRFYARYWKHRQNNLENAKKSLKKGFKGIEVDVHWSGGKFYLSHDPQTSYSNLPTLEELFKKTSLYQYNLWVDFKNLSFFNARNACGTLNDLLEKYEKSDSTIMESKNFYALHLCRQNKLHTSFWMSFSPDTTLGKIRFWFYKQIQKKYKFEFISMDKYLGEKIIKEMSSSYKLLLFTIRNNKEKELFSTRKNIKAMLVANDVSFEE